MAEILVGALLSAIVPAVTAGSLAYSGSTQADVQDKKDEAKKKAEADMFEQDRRAKEKKFLDEELIRRDVARSVQRGQGVSTSGKAGTILTGNLGGVADQANAYAKREIGQ